MRFSSSSLSPFSSLRFITRSRSFFHLSSSFHLFVVMTIGARDERETRFRFCSSCSTKCLEETEPFVVKIVICKSSLGFSGLRSFKSVRILSTQIRFVRRRFNRRLRTAVRERIYLPLVQEIDEIQSWKIDLA